MSYQSNESGTVVTVKINIPELLDEAAKMGAKLRETAAGTAAIASQLYLMQAMPAGVMLVWKRAHGSGRKFNREATDEIRLVFEAMTFAHYHVVIRTLENARVKQHWNANGANPVEFVRGRELAVRLFFEHEGMTTVSDFADGGGATLSFDRRIDTYMKTGSRDGVDRAFIPYLERALGCATPSPAQSHEYRQLFRLIAAGVDAIIDPAPRDLLILPLALGPEAMTEALGHAAATLFTGGRTATPPAPRGEITFKVFVDDNFHYMDEDERYTLGEFPTLDAALVECRKIVEDFLLSTLRPGMSAEDLYRNYTTFGEDPWIVSNCRKCEFSAWDYAKRRCAELCGSRS